MRVGRRHARLPRIVTPSNKAAVGIVAVLLLVGLYLVTNALPARLAATTLRPSAVDAWLPLYPPSVWIYCSYPALFVSAYVIEKDPLALTRFVYADVAANLVSHLVFLLWPTTFPRPELDPASADPLSIWLLRTYWSIDAPLDCFPSLHVSTTILPVLMLIGRAPRLVAAYAAWAAAICVSTMTTKQHAAIDVAGGVLVALATWTVFFRVARYAP